MKDLRISPKQLQSVELATGTVNIWTGSIRSGKTIGSLLAWLLFVATAPRGGALVIIGRTRDSAWRNVVAPLQDPELFGDAASAVQGSYGAPTCTILGRQVFILGAHDSKAEKVIRGLTVAGAYVDEVTTLAEEFFVQLLGRMSVEGSRLFGTTNPDNPAHWLKIKYLDRVLLPPEEPDSLAWDWRHVHFLLEDNIGYGVTQEYVDRQKKQFTGLWYRRFILGEWVAAEGAVFSGWDPAKHVIPHDSLPTFERVIAAGVDHGMQAPSAAIALGLAGGRLYAFDEWWLQGREGHVPTVAEQSEHFRAWRATLPMEPRYVPVDPAALAMRTQLHRDGVPGVVAADNDVSYGLSKLGSLLSMGQLVVSDRCSKLIGEIPGYSWDEKATKRGEDKPVKVADHAIDAWRYAVVTTESTWHRDLRSDLAA